VRSGIIGSVIMARRAALAVAYYVPRPQGNVMNAERWSPNNRMQRAGTHKVLSRGRGRVAPEQVYLARVPTSRRAGADAGR
jgi:hypothetical protein